MYRLIVKMHLCKCTFLGERRIYTGFIKNQLYTAVVVLHETYIPLYVYIIQEIFVWKNNL